MLWDLIGLAAPYGREGMPSRGPLRETFAAGAFGPAIRRGGIVARVDHRRGEAFIIARQDDGTLELRESAAGLEIALALQGPDYWRDGIRRQVYRGAARGWSVAFREADILAYPSAPPVHRRRTVVEVHRLTEVSLCVVTHPAYRSTWASLDNPIARARLAKDTLDAYERDLAEMEAAC